MLYLCICLVVPNGIFMGNSFYGLYILVSPYNIVLILLNIKYG